MKEKEFIQDIKNILNSKYIGDDCAFLKDLGIVITQDSLVEDIHFSRQFATPYQLGYKSVMVNISDVCASGAKPEYLTISLSLPENITGEFVNEFYKGAKTAAQEVKIVGGDITGADKIYISVTAIGRTKGRNISSRANAKIGQKIIVSGMHGSSGAGLKELLSGKKEGKFITAHLMPEAQKDFSRMIAENIRGNYVMMDTSDGLMDALSTIAKESKVCLSVDFDKIPHDKDLEKFADWQDLLFFGGEDYQLVATVPEENTQGTVIGEVKQGAGVEVCYKDKKVLYMPEDVERKLFNHFKEEK